MRKRSVLGAVALTAIAATSALAQTKPLPPPAADVAVVPIECWWKTDRNAVRVGETFSLTLTCAVVDTDRVKVVVDESSLAPSVLRLVPFEIVGGQRFRDILNSPRRFFQYQYTLRVLGEEFFGKDITLPALQLSYRVQNSLSGSSALAGREAQYALRPVPLRVLSLVPPGASDIRDSPTGTFGDVDVRMFRSNLLLMVGGVALVLAGLVAVVLFARTTVKRRATSKTALRPVSPGAVLRAASGELARVRKLSEESGWTGELAGRAAAALRLAGAVALRRPVSQRPVGRETKATEGQVLVGRGFRGKRVALSSAVTASATSVNGSGPIWAAVSQPLAVFTAARYSRDGGIDGTALDATLAEAQSAVKRLGFDQWRRIGRATTGSPAEGGKQSWAR